MVALTGMPPTAAIAEFCQRRRITEMSVFGSAAAGRDGPFSDVDLLITFHPDAQVDLIGLDDIRRDLRVLFGRSVDLIEKPVLERHRNLWLRHSILSGARLLYRAA